MRTRLPTYAHFKPRNQACVWIKRRRIYLGPYGSPESHERYAAIIKRLLAGQAVEGYEEDLGGSSETRTALTIADLAVRYGEVARKRYRSDGKPNAEAEMLVSALEELAAQYGAIPATSFGPLALKAYRDQIGQRLARSTVNAQINRVRRVFRWAAADELIPTSVVTALEAVQGLRAGQGGRETAPVLPVEERSVAATLKHLPQVLADMVRLQQLTGMRPGEVCALRPVDLDRSSEIWRYHPASHKTQHLGKSRVVLIGPQGQALLLKYLTRSPDDYCFSPAESESKRRSVIQAMRTTPLSCGNTPGSNTANHPKRAPGRRYSTTAYRRAIQRACDRAGVPTWSPNQLRHATATAVRAEFGLDGAQIVLGHSHAKTTEIYAERDLTVGEQIARKIG
ncbi:site-specific tyrosine recombinase XerC [Planctomycetes bacterium MalM25]|nr:site-specific tyrosine recombinase XerC [Planctomycetes bacterium MalM25]